MCETGKKSGKHEDTKDTSEEKDYKSDYMKIYNSV